MMPTIQPTTMMPMPTTTMMPTIQPTTTMIQPSTMMPMPTTTIMPTMQPTTTMMPTMQPTTTTMMPTMTYRIRPTMKPSTTMQATTTMPTMEPTTTLRPSYQLKVTRGNPTILNNSNIRLNMQSDGISSDPAYDYDKFNFYMECKIDNLTGNEIIRVGFINTAGEYQAARCYLDIVSSINLIYNNYTESYVITNFPLKLGIYFSNTTSIYYINGTPNEKKHDLTNYFGQIFMNFFAITVSNPVNISDIKLVVTPK
jgi:hypothetical protein